MMFDQTPIGNLVTKCKNWNPQKDGKGAFDYIDLSSIDKDAKRIVTVERYQCSEAPSRARQLVEDGDVLVATVRPNLNGVALVGKAHHGMTASTGYCVLRPVPEKLDSSFLFHWVKTGAFVQKMVEVATGANYPAVSDANVKASTIPLPPLTEQKRIAGILDAADALRAKRRAALAELDALLQSTFLDMFGDPVTNPMGWRKVKLENISNNITDGKHGDCRPEPGSGYFFVSVKDIKGGEIDYSNARQIARADFEEVHRRTQLEPYDVLITNSGTIGRTAVVRAGAFVNQTTFQKSVAIVKPISELVDSFFLRSVLDFNVGNLSRTSSGSSQKNLLLGQLRNFEIPLPPLNLQQRFALVVKSVERHKVRMHAHLAELDALFASLQSKAFNGEL